MIEKLYKILRLSRKPNPKPDEKRNFIIASGGGVATTTLHDFFGAPEDCKHCPEPPSDPGISKAIFITGDPTVQIRSFYNRNYLIREDTLWVRYHCRRMGGDYEKINFDWSLSDYLENGEDIFQLERQFDKWTGNFSLTRSPPPPPPYPILIVKYDNLWENLPAIFEFLNWDPQMIKQFPAKRERAAYPPLSARDKENMEKIYGRLREKYVAAPKIFIRPGP